MIYRLLTFRLSLLLLILALAGCTDLLPGPPPATVTPLPGQSIPALPTATPGEPPLVAFPSTTPAPPGGTPLFPLPTPDSAQPDPGIHCADIYPPQTALRIVAERWTLDQVQAAFGEPQRVSGRPPSFRFASRGCALRVVMGVSAIQRAELSPYFTLGDLLERLGRPPVVAEVAAGINLPGRDRLALVYPEVGLIALFEAPPPAVLSAVIPDLWLVMPGEVEDVLGALGGDTQVVEDWSPPPL